MMLDMNTPVRELALAMPQATRVFEILGIDYCCGGNRSLEEACAVAGVDVRDVQQSLEVAGRVTLLDSDEEDLQQATLADLIKHIHDKHHVFTKLELVRLGVLMAKVCSVHAQNHPELLSHQHVLQQLEDDLLPHMMKEEQMLFPYIIAMEKAVAVAHRSARPNAPFGSVRNPVRMMSLEHDRVGELLREMRRLTSEYCVPPDGCISYRTLFEALEELEKDLHRHIHLENNILFPRAITLESFWD